MSYAAEFADVSKTYHVGFMGREHRPAVREVSFTINQGEVFGLLGPNRAGKTTLVKMLLSLAFPNRGQVQRLGRPVRDRTTLGRVGYVHENHAFPKYLSATALMSYYGALAFVPHEVVRERTPQLLERVGLADRSNDAIRTYSKGMTQRLGIAQALLNDPDLLVLDEPSEGLDLEGRKLMADVVKQHRADGKTVIIVSHVLREIEPLVDRIGVMVGGKMAYLGTPTTLTGPNRSLEEALADLYSRQTA